MRRPGDAEAHRDRHRADAAHVAQEAAHAGRQAPPRPGHAGQRDRVEEALAARRHEGSAGDRRRGRHEVDDADAVARGLGLQVRALVRREVGQDEAGDARLAQPPQDRGAIAAAEHLVDVAHGHQRRVRPSRVDATHELDRVVQSRAVAECHGAGALQRGAVGQRVRVGQADLQQVGPGIHLGQRDGQRRFGIRVAGHGVRDERRPTGRGGRLEGLPDPRRTRHRAGGGRRHATPPGAPAMSRASMAARSLSPRPDRPSRMTSSSPAASTPRPASRSNRAWMA